MPDNIEEEYLGAFDKPDPRDFLADEVVGQVGLELPAEVHLAKDSKYKPKNQANTVRCTAFGSVGSHEVENRLELGQEIIFDPDFLWKEMERLGLTSSSGASLQNALATLKNLGSKFGEKIFKISGFAKVKNTFDDFKNYLAQGFPIYTGSTVTSTNFATAKKTGIWGGIDGSRKTGHAFFIVGYGKIPGTNEEGVEAMNSYGDWGKFKDGTFWIRKNDIPLLFSSYIIYDVVDRKMIFRDVSEDHPQAEAIMWALKNGLMKGENSETILNPGERRFSPDAPISNARFAAIMKRFYDFLSKNIKL